MENSEEKITKPSDESAINQTSDENFSSELGEPHWSVISFEKTEVQNLTYDEAAQKLKDFAADGLSGLCIVTDEAAARISNS